MSGIKTVDVSIMGREFSIACPESELEALLSAVSYLDKKMCDIRDAGKVVGNERIAMMAALNLAHELLSLKSGGVDVGDVKRRVNNMQKQIDTLLAQQDNLF
jgi:cell division protein ZapA